jgi:predicted DNA-binding transcriptional regulator YafY
VLSLPFADPRELVMDILRHVPEVVVIGPQELQEEVVRRLRAGLDTHGALDE